MVPVLEFAKENKKQFYRKWYKRWADRRYYLLEYKDFGTTQIDTAYKDNPEKGSEINALSWIMGEMDFPDGGMFVTEGLWEKYRERFVKNYLLPKVKRNGGYFPRMKKTDAIKELIARGWIHEDDALRLNGKNVYLKCNIAPLVWPEDYYQHQDALLMLNKVGISGYTGTVLPKSK